MPSLIAWLDSTPEEQQAARELIALFAQPESRDELGIGPIRDAFSDLLFPGTSVLQTRARYYLFVPWCYSSGAAAGRAGAEHRKAGRLQERELIKTLRDANLQDSIGLVGSRVGPSVRNLPSDIFWNGMLTYGVRTFNGGIGSLKAESASDGATELTERRATEWDKSMPRAPEGFPERVDRGFELDDAEATWLRDRITEAAQGTVLEYLLSSGHSIPKSAAFPWEAVPGREFEELEHARFFSNAMHGAALLYNLLIAEAFVERTSDSGEDDPVAVYEEHLELWMDDFLSPERATLKNWDLDRMWELVLTKNSNIHRFTRSFVEQWVGGIRVTQDVSGDVSLRELVRSREERKGKQSRLLNEKMLTAWSGASGTGQLGYRWGTVRTIVNDIVEGLGRVTS